MSVLQCGIQPFWHQGPVSWKKIFPPTKVGDDFRMILLRSATEIPHMCNSQWGLCSCESLLPQLIC